MSERVSEQAGTVCVYCVVYTVYCVMMQISSVLSVMSSVTIFVMLVAVAVAIAALQIFYNDDVNSVENEWIRRLQHAVLPADVTIAQDVDKALASTPVQVAELIAPPPQVVGVVVSAFLCGFAPVMGLGLASPTIGTYLMILNGIARWLRWVLGVAFHQPRPFWIDHGIMMLHCPDTYGFPSGHSLVYLALFVPLLNTGAPQWMHWLFSAYFFFMVLGRAFLGTHSFRDLAFGAILAHILIRLLPQRAVGWMVSSPESRTPLVILWAVAVGVLLIIAVEAEDVFTEGQEERLLNETIWEMHARQSGCANTTLKTHDPRSAYSAVGTIVGAMLGKLCSDVFPSLASAGTWRNLKDDVPPPFSLLRFLLGVVRGIVVALVAIWFAFILPRGMPLVQLPRGEAYKAMLSYMAAAAFPATFSPSSQVSRATREGRVAPSRTRGSEESRPLVSGRDHGMQYA